MGAVDAEPVRSDQHGEDYRVAVVRVHVGACGSGLLVTVLEVGRGSGEDRLLGTASSPAAACELLRSWLAGLAVTPP
jgi:hypothetical protein